ncbi:SNW/SKI-interacting protein [Zostera marina]|uniref:SNW/SKI-interacting protein n=1 Tax=Zostera marina TaxID=29655 RepID=A0A0K9NZF4_ZOSMR|nr:SNW/SKI-interacting protein [Zostera marina]
MATLKDILPPAKSSLSSLYDHSNDLWFKERFSSSSDIGGLSPVIKTNPVPPYGIRSGFIPRKVEDFGDGGAFPEIHVAQYPLGMGRKNEKPSSKILPISVDSHGKVTFDAIVKLNENSSKIVYSQHKDLVPKLVSEENEEDEEMEKEIHETTMRTKTALEKIINTRLSAAQPKNVPTQSSDSKFIKYKPSQQSSAFNSGAKERIIRMVEMPVDPLEPPKFKHKRVPKASGSPPVPVMHSPSRPVTVKDQQDWKIPPCISNWKNPKGYTIPLDKRLAADGRGLQEVQINDNLAKLSKALYVAEQKAREAVSMRSKVQKELMLKEKDRKEQELRALAQRARSERTGIPSAPPTAPPPASVDRMTMREEDGTDLREKNLYERPIRESREDREERNSVKNVGGKGKERGGWRQKMWQWVRRARSQETETVTSVRKLLLEWLTQEAAHAPEKSCMTQAQSTMSTLYKLKRGADSEMYGGEDEQLEKVLNTKRFKADKQFSGASERSSGSKRDGSMEFVKQQEESDLFGLDQFLTEVKKGKKAMDKIGSGGTMIKESHSIRKRSIIIDNTSTPTIF